MNVCWYEVNIAIRNCDGTNIGVHKALVVKLQHSTAHDFQTKVGLLLGLFVSQGLLGGREDAVCCDASSLPTFGTVHAP